MILPTILLALIGTTNLYFINGAVAKTDGKC